MEGTSQPYPEDGLAEIPRARDKTSNYRILNYAYAGLTHGNIMKLRQAL